MEEYKIKLMDGRNICGILKSEQPDKIKSDNLHSDTTGQYLSFGKKKSMLKTESMQAEAQRQYRHHLFTENAWFLLANAEEILNDSKMFLAPVGIQNGLAYTGTSGFRRPTVGIYLEWWLYFSMASRDSNGDLVWYISGSPLSGSNCCSVVTPDGKQRKIAQRTPFRDIWQTFMDLNNRYTEAKQRCEAYSLEELLVKLRGEDYKCRIIELQHEAIEMVMDWEKCKLEMDYSRLRTAMDKVVNANKRIQLKQHHSSILEFYHKYLERQNRINELEKAYVAKHKELKLLLHSGTLQSDYQALLAEASSEYKAKKREQSELIRQFIKGTFGKNPNNITPSEIIGYANGKTSV
ncbi:MAG: hypothetical protein K2H76_08900 [Muribaculaceae bacterium]|nr:hypothetical protein [Muribaculaceae bacterium]